MNLHPLLERQLKRHSANNADKLETLSELLQEISEAYYRNDRSQTLFERALDLTSEEFLDKEANTRRELHALEGAQEQVEQLLAMLGATVEISTDALLILDADGEPVLFSERLSEYLCIQDEQLTSLNYDEFTHHLESICIDNDEFIEQNQAILKDDQLASCCTLQLKNGSTLDCHTLPYQQENGKMGRVWNFNRLAPPRL